MMYNTCWCFHLSIFDAQAQKEGCYEGRDDEFDTNILDEDKVGRHLPDDEATPFFWPWDR